jgi:hypothetical protein
VSRGADLHKGAPAKIPVTGKNTLNGTKGLRIKIASRAGLAGGGSRTEETRRRSPGAEIRKELVVSIPVGSTTAILIVGSEAIFTDLGCGGGIDPSGAQLAPSPPPA